MDNGRELTYAEAAREALREEMRRDDTVVIIGEDIKWGVYGVTRGLVDEFGHDRFFECGMCENGFVGASVGAAMTGIKPVAELMYGDFMLVALDAIANEAAKYRYMCGGGDFKVPMVLRISGLGMGTGMGCHHAQCLEATLMHYPGLKVVAPSTPYDAKGLLKTAIRDENPVIYFEHKLLYPRRGPVPEEEYFVPIGEAAVRREGDDVTIISHLNMAHKALEAAEMLAREGISAEVIDLRSLLPLDKKTILESVKKTGRLVIAEEGTKTGGVGAEIAAIVAEEIVEYLNAPIRRIATPDTIIPSTRHNEQYILPNEKDIVEAAKAII